MTKSESLVIFDWGDFSLGDFFVAVAKLFDDQSRLRFLVGVWALFKIKDFNHFVHFYDRWYFFRIEAKLLS